MGLAILKIKIMPESPDSNLGEIEKKAKQIIEKEKGNNLRVEREPIAFGIVAINLTFTREETLDSDKLVDTLGKIKHTSSAEVTDFRRAFG